jgi:hypothetical protein
VKNFVTKSLALSFALSLIASQWGFAQNAIQPASSTVPSQPSLMESLKKTVVFLQTNCAEFDPSGKQIIKSYAGTAFLLGVSDPKLNGGAFTYLVTNRHLAQPGIEDGRPCQPIAYFLRADMKVATSGSYSAVEQIPVNVLTWNYSSDPSVDLAITPISIKPDKVDVEFLPSTLLMSDADITQDKVEEGDSVLFTGLFVQMVGQAHSEPIIREGKIAMMPKEQIPTTLRSLGDVYLVDCHVFGGNSGSPMFIDLAGQREGGFIAGINYKLFGVVSGYVKESSTFELKTVAAYAGTVDANSGVAVVVPAQKILDIINSTALTYQRERALKTIPMQQPLKAK